MLWFAYTVWVLKGPLPYLSAAAARGEPLSMFVPDGVSIFWIWISCGHASKNICLNRLIGSSPTKSTRVFLCAGYGTKAFWCNTSRLDHVWSSLNTWLAMQSNSLRRKQWYIKHMKSGAASRFLIWTQCRPWWPDGGLRSCLGKKTQRQ